MPGVISETMRRVEMEVEKKNTGRLIALIKQAGT